MDARGSLPVLVELLFGVGEARVELAERLHLVVVHGAQTRALVQRAVAQRAVDRREVGAGGVQIPHAAIWRFRFPPRGRLQGQRALSFSASSLPLVNHGVLFGR